MGPPGSACVFGTANMDREHERVYVALWDTARKPDVERTRAQLHLMLTSGAEWRKGDAERSVHRK